MRANTLIPIFDYISICGRVCNLVDLTEGEGRVPTSGQGNEKLLSLRSISIAREYYSFACIGTV